MPQLFLPIFPPGLTFINPRVGFEKHDESIFYFYGINPVYHHQQNDLHSFRFVTSQLIECGGAKAREIADAFGISYISVKRNSKILREEGPGGFFKQKKGRSGHILTEKMLARAQALLYQGDRVSQIAKKLKVEADTLRKAIKAGRLYKTKGEQKKETPKSKSERTIIDKNTSLGIGCTREEERLQAARGTLDSAEPLFEPNIDVPSAGVLFALPALLANGLLRFCDQHFRLPKGYYGLHSLLLTLAFAALLRIKSLEKVRYCDPGELGKIIGLDRIPEVRTLREKVKMITDQGSPDAWSKQLAQYWMEQDPDRAGILYVDGHVRVYHGSQTSLPKRYVAREKLCLSGVTDYWVNDGLGQPFFVVTQTINAGLLAALRGSIIPDVLTRVPNQPTREDLDANPHLCRFRIIFDREGYSPVFFKQLWEQRIACSTYKKYIHAPWPESEFTEQEALFPNGEKTSMKLAERGIYFKHQKLWVREIRRLTESSHQTAVVTTDYLPHAGDIAGHMFARWSQENFFKYMREHYGIDRLVDYQIEKMDETVSVVNPLYKEIESDLRTKRSSMARKQAEYAALILHDDIEEKKVKDYAQKKAALKDMIESLERDISALKEKRKKTARHISFAELPEPFQFQTLKKRGKQFMDSIKMIAYRAETSMSSLLRACMLKKDETRTLIRQVFMTDADLEPDQDLKLLKIHIHTLTNPRNNRYVQNLCDVLNDSETVFPGTDLRLFYDLVSFQIPTDQEF
jgi:prepilin-type processing-associated H-X9-DG protein